MLESGCATPNVPGAYANIAHYNPMIMEAIEKDRDDYDEEE